MVVKDVTTGCVVVEFHSSHYGHENGQTSQEEMMQEDDVEIKEETEEEQQQQIFVEHAQSESGDVEGSGAEQWVSFWSFGGTARKTVIDCLFRCMN